MVVIPKLVPKFVCDRMLKRLAVWLRLSGYDTLCEDWQVDRRKEDTFLVENFTDRILLTRDRELYRRRVEKGYPAKLIKSTRVKDQLREVSELGVSFYPRMERCTICNTPLRRPSKEEVEEVSRRENLKVLKEDLWYCEKCKKLYWIGGHWKNMLKFLREAFGDTDVDNTNCGKSINNYACIDDAVGGRLDVKKLEHLLHHWIEHSREHTSKYEEWAEKIEKENPEVAEKLREAVENFRKGENALESALETLKKLTEP